MVLEGKDQQVVTSFPGESRCSDREGGDRPLGWEWIPLCVEGSGRGAYRGPRSCGGFRVWPQTGRLGGWASEAAALLQLCCLPGDAGAGAAVSLETRRDERSEIDNKSKAKRVETSSSSPPGRGRLYVGRRQARDLPTVVRVHETVQ